MTRYLFLHLILFGCFAIVNINAIPSSISTDPCADTTCGIGAQCEKVSNIIVCVCPHESIGDPFVECKSSGTDISEHLETKSETNAPTTSTTSTQTSAPTTSAITTTEEKLITPAITEISVASQYTDLKLDSNPITSDLDTGSDSDSSVQKGSDDEIMLSHIASAPPTLSHYALTHFHAPQYSQPPASSSSFVPPETLYVPLPFVPSSNFPTSTITTGAPSSYYQHLTELYSGSRTRTRPQQLQQQQHEHDDHRNSNNDNHRDQTNYNPHFYPHIQKHHQSQHHFSANFDLSQTQHHPNSNSYQVTGPSSDQNQGQIDKFSAHESDPFNSYYKDPVGKYDDCRTVNNVIVCAETTDDRKFGSDQKSVRPIPAKQELFKQQIIRRPIPFPTMRPKPAYEDSSLEIGSEPAFNSYRQDGPYGHPPPLTGGNMDFVSMQEQHNRNNYRPYNNNNSNKKPMKPASGTPESKLCEQFCGIDAVCRVFLGRPICGCPEGHSGDPSIRCIPILNSKFDKNTCQRHTNCSPSLVCIESQCIDPCSKETDKDNENSRMCGPNAKCSVIHHTPLCACKEGFDGNPYVGCVI